MELDAKLMMVCARARRPLFSLLLLSISLLYLLLFPVSSPRAGLFVWLFLCCFHLALPRSSQPAPLDNVAQRRDTLFIFAKESRDTAFEGVSVALRHARPGQTSGRMMRALPFY